MVPISPEIDHETKLILARAFDDAWARFLEREGSAADTEDNRRRLAQRIVALAKDAERHAIGDLEESQLADTALIYLSVLAEAARLRAQPQHEEPTYTHEFSQYVDFNAGYGEDANMASPPAETFYGEHGQAMAFPPVDQSLQSYALPTGEQVPLYGHGEPVYHGDSFPPAEFTLPNDTFGAHPAPMYAAPMHDVPPTHTF